MEGIPCGPACDGPGRRLDGSEAGRRGSVGAVGSPSGLLLCPVMPGEMTRMPGLMTNRHQRRAFGGERRTVAVRQLRPGSAT